MAAPLVRHYGIVLQSDRAAGGNPVLLTALRAHDATVEIADGIGIASTSAIWFDNGMTRSTRSTVTCSGLEQAIVAAVQQTSAECRAFLGVYVEQCAEDASGSNWRVKGIKYGRAARAACDDALNQIVGNLKERYVVETRSPPREAPVAKPAAPGVTSLAKARRRLMQRS